MLELRRVTAKTDLLEQLLLVVKQSNDSLQLDDIYISIYLYKYIYLWFTKKTVNKINHK